MIQAILLTVGLLAGVGLIVGGLIALAVILWTDNIPAAVDLIGNGYYLLVGLMPVVLWFALYLTHDDEEYRTAYASRLRAALTMLQGAIVGSVLGAGPIFLAVVVNLPVIVNGFAIDEFGPAVRETIVWSRLWLAVAAAVASALPLGFWAYYTNTRWDDD